MSHVFGTVPIGGLPESSPVFAPTEYNDLPAELQAALRPRVQRLGYLGAFFAFAGAQPAALYAFNEFTEALRAALPEDIVDVISLAVSAAYSNRYENVQHRRLAARHGHSEAWILAASDGIDIDLLDERQRSVRDLVVSLVAGQGHESRAELAKVHERLGREGSAAVLLLAGRYICHAHIANALELTVPEVRSMRE